MKITRRLLALLLALCLTFGNVMPAMATELAPEEPVATETPAALAEEQTPTEEVSGTTGIEDNPFESEEPTEEPTVEPTTGKPSTPHEIVDAAYALEKGTDLEGTYTLTGKIIGIDTPYDSGYGNITVTIAVEGRETKPIMCFRLAGTGADTLAKNDIITVTGTLTNYNGTIEFKQGCTLDNVVKGEPDPTDPDAEKPTASISFADKANRTSYSTTEQVWQQNGITVTNTKHNSTSNVGDYANPARFYKSSKVVVEYPGMTKIVFTCGGAQYVITELSDLGNVSTDGFVVTLELSSPADSIEFVTTAQRRVATIDVYATGISVDPVEPTEPAATEPVVTEPVVTEPVVTEPVATEPQPTEPEATEPAGGESTSASIDFSNGSQRTSFSTTQQVWTADGLTMTLDKAKATSDMYDHIAKGYGEIRIYNGATVKIEYPGMTKIVFNVDDFKENYVEFLVQSISGKGTVTTDGLVVTLELVEAVDSLEYTAAGTAQHRLTGITAYAEAGSVEPPVDPTEPQPTEPQPTEPEATEPVATEPAGDEELTSATINFGNADHRTSYSAEQQVWANGGATLTNDKNTSSNDIYDHIAKGYGEIRLYAGTKVTIEYPGMTKVVFTCDTYKDTYADALKNSISGFGTVTVDGLIVTLELTEPVNSFTYLASAQHRLTEMTVYGTGKEVEEEEFIRPETPAAIVEAAYALPEGAMLPEGPYTLTGKIISVDEAYDAEWSNVTVTIAVEGCETMPIKCYHMKGTGADTVKVGDIITVSGDLTNYEGTIEFATGCALIEVVPGEPEATEPQPTEPAGPTVEAIGDGVYVISTNGLTFALGALTGEYGYVPANDVASYSELDALIIKNYGGGITIQDHQGRYMYMAGTYNSFNVSWTMPTEGHIWQLMNDGTNLYLVNELTGKTVSYSSKYGSWGAYETVTEGYALTVDKYIAVGAEERPEQVTFTWNNDYTEATATVVVPANTVYYVTFVTGMMGGDMMLTINGEPYGIVNGSRFQPYVLSLLNETDAEETYTLVLTYPAGSQMNPDTLHVGVIGEGEGDAEGEGFNLVWLEPDDMDGYLFSWTADADGKLTITMENGAAGWAYSIYNMSTYTQTEMHYSSDIPNVNAETIDVKAGDQIQVMINTCGENEYDIPGGEVAFVASFEKTIGSAQNPYEIDADWAWNEDYTGATASVTVPANFTYHIRTWMNGKELSINGAQAFALEDPEFDGIIVPLVNDTDAEMVFELVLTVPEYVPEVGTWDNPAALVAGENFGTVAADSWNGYLFNYIAPANGSMTVVFSATDETGAACGWSYQINNMTAGIWGDMMNSADNPNDAVATVSFSKGDEIQINVNTFIPDSWNTPAGTIKLDVEFQLAEAGSEGNPIDLEAGTNTVELPEGVTGYYYGYKATEAGTLNVSVYDANYEYVPFTVNGAAYTEPVAVAEGDYVVIYVECAGPATVTIDLYFEAVPGSVNNPIAIMDPMMGVDATVGAYETIYYSARNVGGSKLYIHAFGENMVLELDGVAYELPAYEELVVTVPEGMGFFAPPTSIAITNNNWETQDVNFYFQYDAGHQSNPAELVLGKNTADIAAGTQGYYYKWTATGSGFLELTMNTKTGWNYVINNVTAGKYGDMCWSDMTPVPTKGYMAVNEGDEIEIIVNTYDPENPYSAPAGTVAFTAKMIKSYNDSLASGKSMTLKYIDPTNGKTIANSKVTWEMFMYQLDEWGDKVMDENWQYVTMPVPAEVATLKTGKLTATAGLTESTAIVVKGTYGETENIYNITVYPAATAIQIDARYEKLDNSGVKEEILENVNDQTLTYDLANQYLELGAIATPDAALQDVVWTSSNTKVLTINNFADGTISLEPVVNFKTMKVGTGTVTITATAKDGSGIKASVKVKVTCSAIAINVSSKNGQTVVGSGKSLTMVADVPFAVNKAVTWDVKVLNVPSEDFDHASVATISAKGVLTAKKGLTVPYTVEVSATAKDGSGVVGTTEIVIAPVATKVVVDAPATHDLTNGNLVDVSATALSMSGEKELYSSSDVKWTVSNKKIGNIEYVEEYSYEIWDYVQVPKLVLTGKTGKITLTATATDGSNVKKSVTVNVVKSPETLTLSTNDAVLAVGKSLSLKATVGPNNATDKKVIWSAKALINDPTTGEYVELSDDIGLTVKNGKVSLNTKKVKALINEGGMYPVIEVTATANMADAWGEPVSDTCWIQLCAATTKVSLIRFGNVVNGKTLTMDDDAVMVLGVDYVPSEAGYYHNWKSSNTKIATVTENWDGTVTVKPTGTKLGTVTITATAADGSAKSASVKVKVVRKVDKIDVDTSSFALSGTAKGKTFDLNKLVTVSPSNASNKKVTWSIAAWSTELAKTNKITLSAAGKLTVKMNVEAPVTISVVAKAADGLGASKTFQLTITPAATKVSVMVNDKVVTDAQQIEVGEKLPVAAVSESEAAADLFNWKSSNAKVAKIVVEDGVVYVVGIKAGTAKITATAADGSGKSATVTFQVVKKNN